MVSVSITTLHTSREEECVRLSSVPDHVWTHSLNSITVRKGRQNSNREEEREDEWESWQEAESAGQPLTDEATWSLRLAEPVPDHGEREGPERSPRAGVSGGAGRWGGRGRTHRGLSRVQGVLAAPRCVERGPRGWQAGRGQRVADGGSDGPVPGKTPSESNEMGGGHSGTCGRSLPRKATICRPADVCSGAVTGDGGWRSWDHRFILWPRTMAAESGLSLQVGSLSRLPCL